MVPGEVVPGDVVPGEVVPGEWCRSRESCRPGALVPGVVPPGAVVPLCVETDAPDRCWIRGGVSAGGGTVGGTDGGGDPSGIASPTGVIPVPGTPTGTGGSAAVGRPGGAPGPPRRTRSATSW